MPLSGTLSTMSLPDLLQWLGGARRTGTLEIERNKVFKWFLFRDGRVIGCSSDDPPERIGHFLLSRGKINEDQLREALELQEQNGRHLGTILVQRHYLSQHDLTTHLAAKAEETIYSVFDWDDGVFRFEETLDKAEHVMPVSLQVEDILLRGLKRYDEMRMIREVFNDPGILLGRTERIPPAEVLQNRMARRIYDSIDGERTVGEILLIAHGSEYIVTKFLYELQRNGFVEILGKRQFAADAPGTADADGPAGQDSGDTPAPPEADQRLIAVGAELDAPSAPPGDLAVAARSTAGATMTATVVTDEDAASAEEPAGGLEADLAASRDLMTRGEYEGALTILDGLYRTHTEDSALQRLMREAEAAFIEKAYRHYLPARKIPSLTRPVAELASAELSPTEFFLLSRIDGTWDVKSIIQIAPLREVEALRTLKRMREQGIIELRDPES